MRSLQLKLANKRTQQDLVSVRAELQLYKDTWGSVVASGIQPEIVGVSDPIGELTNNSSATNVSWETLRAFLWEDKTDEKTYIPDVYDCDEFASDLHNNAESKGIRCAWVAIKFKGGGPLHALNAFKTTDQGLVFVDCTGEPVGRGPANHDSTVVVRLGLSYTPQLIFSGQLWYFPEEGIILDIQIFW